MNHWARMTHGRLWNRLEVEGILEAETGIHVGTGGEADVADAAVIRDFDGAPFLPGSSLKGALRSAVERRIDWFGLNGLWSCRLEEGGCLSTSGRTEQEVEPGVKWREKDLAWRIQEMQQHLCATCKLFGSTVFAGKVRIDDAPLTDPFRPIARRLVEVRDGVAIDRDTGTAASGLYFQYETVPSRTSFRFRLTAENLTTADAGLLALGLLELTAGDIPVGGKSTRGLGRVVLAIRRLHHFEFPEDDPESKAERLVRYVRARTRSETDASVLRGDEALNFLSERIEALLQEA